MPAARAFVAPFCLLAAATAQDGQMDGYLGVPTERVDPAYGGGFSMHVAAWPLLGEWPGDRFQTGLFGTWMHARLDEKVKDVYSDIEGGLGWWRDTRFATATPKFIMGGVALNFVAWANGPGAGKGRDWNKPQGKYGIAQLSPWVLWPPDGLDLAQGTCGELFGYGYLPLPLTEPKTKTAGKDVPTGNQCWTLFLDTADFKGPVAFFTPFFFASPTLERPDLAGMFLDARPADPNRALQMETQYVPAVAAKDDAGTLRARVAPTRFPVDAEGRSVLVHHVFSYRKQALWDAVQTWFDGGAPASGRIDLADAAPNTFSGKGWSTWRIHTPDVRKDDRVAVDWARFATPFAADPQTFCYRWDPSLVRRTGDLVVLPEHFAVAATGKKPQWRPTTAEGEPAALRDAVFAPKRRPTVEPYVTPEDGCWTRPGPVAGPFTVALGDGSVVTYSWYRFADQPALRNADLSDAERERMQVRVEKLHRHWTKDRTYLPPPAVGKLARLDPALLVVPPKGFEIGYVPIVTRQAAR